MSSDYPIGGTQVLGPQTVGFAEGEADRWYERNAAVLARAKDDVLTESIQRLGLAPRRILEIGCANGWRLQRLAELTSARCAGVEPSALAVAAGREVFPGLELAVGTADHLPYADASFDLVVFGFCLYLVDPTLHFRAIAEADRVLASGGHLAIFDFQSAAPYHNNYHHKPGLQTFKMEFSRLLLAHPGYVLIHRELKRHGPEFAAFDQREGVDILLKDMDRAFPPNPFPRKA